MSLSMGQSSTELDPAIDWLKDLFASDLTKVLLSLLILLSILPVPWAQSFSLLFFGVFALELALRILVFIHDLKRRKVRRMEILFLFFDLLATLSFLPLEAVWDDVRFLRLFRLSRMLLLIGYWGPIVREIGFILSKRERRYQLAFVGFSVVLLSFTVALLLEHFKVAGIDFNGDGNLMNDNSFWSILWWSFRQIESPDNLLTNPDWSIAFFFSIFLTLSGLFLFSFLIGIGNSVVEELVALSKERRIGMRKQSVICNVSPHTEVLLKELVTYYAKSFRSPKIVTLGPNSRRYDYMYDGPLRQIRYRQGRALSRHDLVKVDADRARRVILLGKIGSETSDSEIVSQILSIREVNTSCSIYAELFQASNVPAAHQAGGERLVPIMTRRLVSMFLANIIVFPGVEGIYHELLTSLGDEIYTCLYDRDGMAGVKPPSGPLMDFGDLLERCHKTHGVLLLGHLLQDPGSSQEINHVLSPGILEPAVARVDQLCGFFGIGANFESIKSFVHSLPDVCAPQPDEAAQTAPLFGVCPGASNVSRLLICGFHNGIVDFIEELFLFSTLQSMILLVPDERGRRQVFRAFADHNRGISTSTAAGHDAGNTAENTVENATEARVTFSVQDDQSIRCARCTDPAHFCEIIVAEGDWSDESVLLEFPGTDRGLAEMDAILLTYSPEEADPDARTALALLKLVRLQEHSPQHLKPGFRIFCEVQNTEKADLFQRRFGPSTTDGNRSCSTLSIIAAERLRNAFLAQAIFVPSIADIYQELLGSQGMYLCKLLRLDPQSPEVPLTFGQLLAVLYRRDGFLLVAVELEDPVDGTRALHINPRPRSEHFNFTSKQLVSVYAIGQVSTIPKSQPCMTCFSRAGTSSPEIAPEDQIFAPPTHPT